jgi:hypothetical protein
MTKQEIILLLIGHLAVFIHCLMKLNSLLTDARVAHINFNSWNDYWKRDAVGILISASIVWLWLLAYSEVVGYYPKWSGLLRMSFILVGFTGSYIVQLLLSRSKKLIRNQIDAKTNQLSDITGQDKTEMKP